MSTIRYMHTINGHPAVWNGNVILIPNSIAVIETYPDFETIKKHRRISIKVRTGLGWDILKYGHRRVKL